MQPTTPSTSPGRLNRCSSPTRPDHPLFRIVPDRAGVHEHHVGVIGRVDALVAFAREHAEHELGVGDVHLAAVGLDVDALGHRGKDTPPADGGVRHYGRMLNPVYRSQPRFS